MKKRLKWLSVVGGLAALVFTSTAYAMSFTHRGIYCETGKLGVVCMRKDGRGFGVGLSKHAVVVTNPNGKTVFQRYYGG